MSDSQTVVLDFAGSKQFLTHTLKHDIMKCCFLNSDQIVTTATDTFSFVSSILNINLVNINTYINEIYKYVNIERWSHIPSGLTDNHVSVSSQILFQLNHLPSI